VIPRGPQLLDSPLDTHQPANSKTIPSALPVAKGTASVAGIPPDVAPMKRRGLQLKSRVLIIRWVGDLWVFEGVEEALSV
jgi:hypothetical protein